MLDTKNKWKLNHEYWYHIEGDDNDIYTVQREGGSIHQFRYLLQW